MANDVKATIEFREVVKTERREMEDSRLTTDIDIYAFKNKLKRAAADSRTYTYSNRVDSAHTGSGNLDPGNCQKYST